MRAERDKRQPSARGRGTPGKVLTAEGTRQQESRWRKATSRPRSVWRDGRPAVGRHPASEGGDISAAPPPDSGQSQRDQADRAEGRQGCGQVENADADDGA